MSERTHIPLFRTIRPKKAKKGFLLRKTRLNPISQKGKLKHLTYNKMRAAFLEEHPYCQWTIAERGLDEAEIIKNHGFDYTPDGRVRHEVPRSTEIHHKKGRGKFYLDITTWMACKPGHERYIHGNPKDAYEKGYMLPRNK